MKIQIVSDTHCNYDYSISPDCDLVAHLGDFGNGGLHSIDKFADKCTDAGKNFVFVLGNHDLFMQDYTEMRQEVEDKYPNNFLTEGKEILVNGYCMVGDVLFSNFELYSHEPYDVDKYKLEAQAGISDFHCVKLGGKLVTPDDYVTLFNKQYNWIEKYRGRDDVVVLTHFLPNKHCISDYWLNHPSCWRLNAYFASNINVKGFKHWFYGHSHSQMDKVVDGCRLVNNAKGYPNEFTGMCYEENLIIELPQL